MASPASARTQLTSHQLFLQHQHIHLLQCLHPHLTLASLGLEPVAEHTFHSGHAVARPCMTVLKFDVIEEQHEFIIFF